MRSREHDPPAEDDLPVLIVGYGNPLRGDDGVGPAAAERLRGVLRRRRRLRGRRVEVRACHQLTPELAEPISRARLVIFVDASHGLPPGAVACRQLAATPGPAHALCHHADAEAVLRIADRLYGHAPQAYAFAVGGVFWGYAETLSPEATAALPQLIDRIATLVSSFRQRPESRRNALQHSDYAARPEYPRPTERPVTLIT